MEYVFGLGKSRSRLGKFIDQRGITQDQLSKMSKTSRNTISALCHGGKSSGPYEATQIKIISALRKAGYDVRPEDFW